MLTYVGNFLLVLGGEVFLALVTWPSWGPIAKGSKLAVQTEFSAILLLISFPIWFLISLPILAALRNAYPPSPTAKPWQREAKLGLVSIAIPLAVAALWLVVKSAPDSGCCILSIEFMTPESSLLAAGLCFLLLIPAAIWAGQCVADKEAEATAGPEREEA